MALAPITHGSRMDHFYAVDTTGGFTYIGHCEQTAQATGQLTLVRYCVLHTAEVVEKQNSEGKEYGQVVTAMYLKQHSKMSTVALGSEHRVAIHILDDVLKQAGGG